MSIIAAERVEVHPDRHSQTALADASQTTHLASQVERNRLDVYAEYLPAAPTTQHGPSARVGIQRCAVVHPPDLGLAGRAAGPAHHPDGPGDDLAGDGPRRGRAESHSSGHGQQGQRELTRRNDLTISPGSPRTKREFPARVGLSGFSSVASPVWALLAGRARPAQLVRPLRWFAVTDESPLESRP